MRNECHKCGGGIRIGYTAPEALCTCPEFKALLACITSLFDIEGKILKALVTSTPSTSMFGMGAWLARVLTPEELHRITEAERTYSERVCDRWLGHVLAKSGKYDVMEDGFYLLKSEFRTEQVQ